MPGNFNSLPLSVAASWPAPNYVDPVRRPWLPALSGTFLAVTALLVTGRLYLRSQRLAGGYGLDDVFIVIGWLFSVGLTTVAIIGVDTYELDRHTWDVHRELYPGAALMGFLGQVTFLISTSATKVSVLLFYRRVVKDSYTKTWLYCNYTAIAFIGAYFLSVFLSYCFMCQPLEAYWRAYDLTYTTPYTCIDGSALVICVGSLSIFSDIVAVILPMMVLRSFRLDLPLAQIIGLHIIFALGLLVAGAGGARTYQLWLLSRTYDTSWVGFDLFLWTLLEANIAIICACLPSFRVFLRRYVSKPLGRTQACPASPHCQKMEDSTTQLSSQQSRSDIYDKAAEEILKEQAVYKTEGNGIFSSYNASKPLTTDMEDLSPMYIPRPESRVLEMKAKVSNESYV